MSERVIATMKDIGRLIGMSSHEIGKFLKRQGLRTSEGKPSQKAFSENLVAQKFDGYGHYLWAWDRDAVLGLLDSAGVKPVEISSSAPVK